MLIEITENQIKSLPQKDVFIYAVNISLMKPTLTQWRGLSN